MSFWKKLFGGDCETAAASFAEKDNVGDRHDSSQRAIGYWMGERMRRERKDPFVMHEFESANDARNGLLALPCIKIASDTGNLICTKPLIFGYYQTDSSHWEAVLCGDDLAHDLWSQAREAFRKNGGTLKNELEPQKKATAGSASVGKAQFVGKETKNVQGNFGMAAKCTYEVYKAPNAATAQDFLRGKTVTQQQYYVVVETPEGNYGRDVNGIYKE